MKRYVPNLIPERHRVLPEYFTGDTISNRSLSAWNSVQWVLAAASIIMALVVLPVHGWFAFSLSCLSVLISPWFEKLIQTGLQFRMTGKLRAVAWGVAVLWAAFNGNQYQASLADIRERERLAEVARIEAVRAAQAMKKARLDSIHFLLTTADYYKKRNTYPKAIATYQKALGLIEDNDGLEQRRVAAGLVTCYLQTRKYALAADQLGVLLAAGSDPENYYQRGLCYQKLGYTSKAIGDFYAAAKAGDQRAIRVYNKMNPLIRRVLYYQTVCCDGTYSPSNAKGRGACSHHGGVCNWNKPIYEEYRKYEYPDL